jgi:CMP-N-acetylneuraminic acid synthetase
MYFKKFKVPSNTCFDIVKASHKSTTSLSLFRRCHREFLLERSEVDLVALVQCTSPFVRTEFLNEALDLAVNNEGGCDSVFSVTRQKKMRWKEVQDDQKRKMTKDLNPKSSLRISIWVMSKIGKK